MRRAIAFKGAIGHHRALASWRDPFGGDKTKRNLAVVAWTVVCGVVGAKVAFSVRDNDKPKPRFKKPTAAQPQPTRPPVPDTVYDAAIIGGGVVGLAVARELAVTFPERRFILLEKSPDLVPGASSGNSGLGCTGYDAPAGSLERKLLRRSAQRHPNLYRTLGLSYEQVRKSGALVVAWDEEQLEQLATVHRHNIDAGDTEARILTASQLLELEPGLLKSEVQPLGAVLVPREAISEPWLVPIAYAENAKRNGCEIRTNSEVMSLTIAPSTDSQADGDATTGDWFWTITTKSTTDDADASTVNAVGAKVIINCAGLFGDEVEAMRSVAAVHAAKHELLSVEDAVAVAAAGETAQTSGSDDGHEHRSFAIKPRKGQFVMFDPPSDWPLQPPLDHIIEPVPSQFTKGVIVWTTLYGQIVIGPTAENQDSRTDRSTTSDVLSKLRAYGRKVLGNEFMNRAQEVGTYAGIRPATEYRDYQVG